MHREAYRFESVLKRLGLGEALGELWRRPLLLAEAVRTFFATRRLGGFGPSTAYLEWRSYTAYGDHKAGFEPTDLVHYLSWRRRLRRRIRGRWSS